MSYKITPARKIVVLKPVAISQASSSLIEVAVTSDKKQEMGEVISIGTGKLPVKFKKGDWLAYRVFGGTKFLIGGQEVIFAGFDDILGVIKK